MRLTLNVKDLRALTSAFKWGSLQAAVFNVFGVEVHASVVPFAQN